MGWKFTGLRWRGGARASIKVFHVVEPRTVRRLLLCGRYYEIPSRVSGVTVQAIHSGCELLALGFSAFQGAASLTAGAFGSGHGFTLVGAVGAEGFGMRRGPGVG